MLFLDHDSSPAALDKPSNFDDQMLGGLQCKLYTDYWTVFTKYYLVTKL